MHHPVSQSHSHADLIITNAKVLDGSGASAVNQAVAVKDDKIVAMGDLQDMTAAHTLDAKGLYLAPGFIDVHTHDDLELLRNPSMTNKISQGVTSVIIGNCGISASPYASSNSPPDPINLLGKAEEFCYACLQDYIVDFEAAAPYVNAAALVGHTSLRAQVMKDMSVSATEQEIAAMTDILRGALAQGAIGLSTGLAYKNAQGASTAEVAALVGHLAEFNGVYSTHLRTEFDGIIDALDEAFTVAQHGNTPLVISHLKCAGKNNWGRAQEVSQHIKKRQTAQKISCDCYPYHASSSTLDLAQVTEDFDIFITWSESHPEKAKQTLQSIAKQWELSLMDAAKKLQPAGAVYHGMKEDDMKHFLALSFSMVGSDGLPCDPHPHPRLWGAFPRVLGRYCRDQKLFGLAQAVHKMTGLSASEFSIDKRGFLRVGYYADLVLFDAQNIADMADFTDPMAMSTGIEKVWVNGQLSFQSHQAEGAVLRPKKGAGRFLKRQTNAQSLA
ncbi:amidohydrolase family protein [Glaciecola siphonariae]|uniref:Amidohydrolase family protein n=1 Tax=Glaciecola siphonariae TaxID=521012 RepID=A0ABV9M039_9ALTE